MEKLCKLVRAKYLVYLWSDIFCVPKNDSLSYTALEILVDAEIFPHWLPSPSAVDNLAVANKEANLKEF